MGPSRKDLDGIEIALDSYYVHDTYSGVIMGLPTVEETVEFAKHTLQRMWGDRRPVIVVPPVLKDGPERKGNREPEKYVPGRCMMAWLTSWEKQDPDDDGTHLFVIWFDEVDAQDPLLAALKHVHEAGGWKKNAVGWCM